jgi:hypothetical protein
VRARASHHDPAKSRIPLLDLVQRPHDAPPLATHAAHGQAEVRNELGEPIRRDILSQKLQDGGRNGLNATRRLVHPEGGLHTGVDAEERSLQAPLDTEPVLIPGRRAGSDLDLEELEVDRDRRDPLKGRPHEPQQIFPIDVHAGVRRL